VIDLAAGDASVGSTPAWVAAQSRGSLYTTSVNEAELFYGISAMPEGRRRSGLAAGTDRNPHYAQPDRACMRLFKHPLSNRIRVRIERLVHNRSASDSR
jgi:hypothetical protein